MSDFLTLRLTHGCFTSLIHLKKYGWIASIKQFSQIWLSSIRCLKNISFQSRLQLQTSYLDQIFDKWQFAEGFSASLAVNIGPHLLLFNQEFSKSASVVHQLLVGSNLWNFPVLQNNYLIHLWQEFDAVGHQDPRFLPQRSFGTNDLKTEITFFIFIPAKSNKCCTLAAIKIYENKASSNKPNCSVKIIASSEYFIQILIKLLTA